MDVIKKNIEESFVSKEHRHFKWSLGSVLASSLSGFLAGIVVTLIIIYALFDITLK